MAGRFPTAWMDDFYSRVDIVQVVSAYVPLKKNGSRYWGLCPFHHEKTPSFSVNGEQNLYYCFGCKAGGNVVQFVEEMEHLTYREAVEYLAKQIHMPIPETQEDPDYERRRSQRERLLGANKAAARWYHAQLWLPENQRILDYLHKRGLDDGTIRKFGLGAAPEEWDALTRALEQQGYTQDELRLAGLTVVKQETRFDMFRSRAIFPIIDAQGQVLGFGGRAMGDAQPKYLNTSDTPVFNKRKGVYAANLLRKQRDLKRVILVEGYMDVVALIQHGVNGVVATLGTALTNEQARLLKRYAPEIWVSYDGDSAGQHAIMRALEIFEQEDIRARVLFFPDNLDPDEFIRQRGLDAFEHLRPLKAAEYRMQRAKEDLDLSDDDQRIEYAKRCAQILSKVREPVELETYLQTLAVQTGFSKDVLRQQMGLSIAEENNAKPPRERIIRRRAGDAPAASMPEKTLIALLVSGLMPKDAVRDTDFDDPQLHMLAQKLLAGSSPAAILAECETEQQRVAYSEAFALNAEITQDNAAAVAEDCLRTIRQTRLQRQIDDIRAQLDTCGSAEKADMLKELLTLSNELARLKRAVH
ncbi:MAG: DNA primase [Clostridiales bacterium]|nr:DNA primase [Clostridiales bacterium]MDY5469200.1 DNA primase [Eubacteriales bacterium]